MVDVNEILSTTSFTIYKFISYKNGGDCMLLYFRYLIQSRIQTTANTYSTDSFMIKAMGWGKDRFANAKKVLIDTGFIEPIIRRAEYWTILSHFIRVKFDIGFVEQSYPEPPLPREWVEPATGKRETNTIEEKINTIEEKENTLVVKIETIKKRPKISSKSVDVVLSTIKESLYKSDYSYSSIKERMWASNLLRNNEWKKLVEESGWDWVLLVSNIMEYANEDAFWVGKITSAMSFYYKFPILSNQMKTKGLFKRTNAKEDEERKLAALEFFKQL